MVAEGDTVQFKLTEHLNHERKSNMPWASDVKQIAEEIAELDKDLADPDSLLSAEVEELEDMLTIADMFRVSLRKIEMRVAEELRIRRQQEDD